MANKVKIDYSQFRASGVYTLEFDATQNVILTSQTVRLVVGFSNKGPFNTPVYIPDATTMISIFGDIDKSLENQGSFFHRSILTCLNAGPVFALNLLKLNDDASSTDADLNPYKAFSLDTEEDNGVVTEVLYSAYYNKERFWYADPAYFLAALSTVDTGKLLSLTNVGKSPMSLIIRKSTDSSKPLKGYDIFAIDWYGANNVPTFMHPYDYMSDYFIDVIAVSGDWTNYSALSVDPKWGYNATTGAGYFTANGFVKSKIDSFLSDADINIVSSVTGCIIPDFIDLNGINQFIQTLINNDSPSTGLFCAIDSKAFDNICANGSKIDLVGNHLIDEFGVNKDLVNPTINFLSYDQALLQDSLYTRLVIGATGYSGFLDIGTTGALQVGSLFSLHGSATGGTAGVIVGSFAPYNSSLTYGGLHYLETLGLTGTTGGFQTAAQKTALKDFLAVSSSNDQKFIIGSVSGITAGTTGDFINQYTQGTTSLVRLKVTGTAEISGELRISWTHPLDTAFYSSQGITVAPTPYVSLYDAGGGTRPFYTGGTAIGGSGAYFFGVADSITTVTGVETPGGVTGPNAPTGTSTVVRGYNGSSLFQDVKFNRLTDGSTVWLNSDGSSINYLAFEAGVDRDQFNFVNARSYTSSSLAGTTINNIVAFTGSGNFASNNIGSPVSAGKFNIVSQNGNINSFVTCTRVDSTSFTISQDSNGNAPLAVGDLVVSTDLDICIPDSGNRQSRLTKIVSVSSTATSGVYTAKAARPVLYYSGTNNTVRVQKFKSIAQFTTSFEFTYLKGFTLKSTHRPNGTDARTNEILDVLYNTNLAKTLAQKQVISYRYIIDTFNGIIGPESKSQYSRLAQLRGQALAIINAPSLEQFRTSTNPRFTDAPTATNPYPMVKVQYITTGGNLSLNPSVVFSLPTEGDGAKYSAYYSPYITIRENNKNISVPPAALVSNNFVRKFATGEPYAIVAGQKRGTLSGGSIVGVEYDFTDDDRGDLEAFGINPIVKRRGSGVVIMGNQTAYQQVNSAFNLVHVRDLLISIESDVEAILSNYLFDFNDDSIRLEIKTLVDNYLDGVRAGGGIYAYQTIMDSSNNTQAIIDMNMGVIDIILEPARGLQKFINRITVTKIGGIAAGGFTQFA
jgi:hypothetical protein